MKWKMFVALCVAVVVVVLAVGAPGVARADGPTDAQYAMIQCSGLPIDLIVSGEQQYDTAYGFAHQLTSDAAWRGTYVERTNEFAHRIGCADVLTVDENGAALTLSAKIYGPTFRAIATHGALRY